MSQSSFTLLAKQIIKMSLKVVTFANTVDERINTLKNSCAKLALPLEILGIGEEWRTNAIKLSLLNKYFLSTDANDDDHLLIVDAFDVDVIGGESGILELFSEINVDVLFSAEANFYFRDRILK
jgi:hypothetical protein